MTGVHHPLQQLTEFSKSSDRRESITGLLIALSIISIWATSLFFLCSLDLNQVPDWIIPLAMLWQIFLYTGLFITAHDAMHGAVFPLNPKVNNGIGAAVLLLYGLFSYKKLLKKHWMHHHHPATHLDPDFHDGKHRNPIAWYLYFMKGYWSWRRLFGLMTVFNVLSLVLHVPEQNMILFWVLPSILSSVQLFFFGTFLPHREPKTGYSSTHRATTYALPPLWSFIACYHFGYHEEHHEHPNVPWWRLPKIYKIRSASLV